MAWIDTVSDQDAQGGLAQIFAAARQRAGCVRNIVRVMSPNPGTLRASMGLYLATMQGDSPLARSVRELLATVVSKINSCHY